MTHDVLPTLAKTFAFIKRSIPLFHADEPVIRDYLSLPSCEVGKNIALMVSYNHINEN